MSDVAQAPPPPQSPPAESTTAQNSSTSSEQAANPASATSPAEDRSELLQRARTFLTSPQVVHEDPLAKRRFLAEKGLNELEIEQLIQELVSRQGYASCSCEAIYSDLQPPIVPPRTYPQPPPSNIPNLLAGALRIITWIAGGSAALILLYFVSLVRCFVSMY